MQADILNVYKTNYSFLGHGPLVSARARLPYAFRLSLMCRFLEHPDRLPKGREDRSGQRSHNTQ